MPALRFEELTGISGLSKEYIMPDGKSMQEVELEIREISNKNGIRDEQKLEAYKAVYNDLQNLNPEIGNIYCDRENKEKLARTLRGIVSGFSEEDISAYNLDIESGLGSKIIRQTEVLALGNAINVSIKWHISYETEEKIRNYFGIEEDWEPTRKELKKAFNKQFNRVNASLIAEKRFKKEKRNDIFDELFPE